MPRDNRPALNNTGLTQTQSEELFLIATDMLSKTPNNGFSTTRGFGWGLTILDSAKVQGLGAVLSFNHEGACLWLFYKAEDFRSPMNHTLDPLSPEAQAIKDQFDKTFGSCHHKLVDIDSPFLKAVMDAV